MKWSCILISLFTVALCMVPAWGITEDNISVQSIRVAGDSNYAPYEFVDEDGNYRGFNVDVMNALSAQMGVDFVLTPMYWNEAVRALDSGEVDVIQGMNISKDREHKYIFTSPTVINTIAIFVGIHEEGIESIQDLSGKRVAVQKGDIGMELLASNAGIHVVALDDQEDCVALLGRGEVDAFLGDRQAGLSYVRQLALESKIKIVGTPLKMSGYGIAVRQEDEALSRRIEQGLEDIKLNGTYQKIYEKWFGVQFQDESVFWKKVVIVAVSFLALAMMIATTVYIWNRTLVRQVRVRTEELDRSNRKRHAILESVPDPIIATDKQGAIVLANHAAQQFMEERALDGASILAWRPDGPLDEAVVQAVAGGKAYSAELECTQGGEHRYFACNVSPILGADRCAEGSIVVLHDHTELLLLKNALYQNDKLSALGRMAAGIAHELRNPLTAIKAYVDMIDTKIDNKRFREKLVEVVPAEIDRMNDIINTLLDYARTRPKIVERVEIAPILNQVVELYQISLNKKRIAIDVAAESLVILADAQQVKQVLINILLNSIEAIEDGGEIRMETGREGGWGLIRVRDNGCGIAPDALEHIFEPFCSSKAGGHGFGLLIVHNLVQENGGSISYESTQGKGTVVTLYFPLAGKEVRNEATIGD